MPLHPQTQGLLQAMAAMPAIDYATITAPELRRAFDTPGMFAPGDAVAAIENSAIPTARGDLPIRLYRPLRAEGALPVVVYFHGGGFVTGTLDTHDNICRCLANRASCLVISIGYRLAPEAPFPAGVEDAWFALNWLYRNVTELGGDSARMAVAGDSSGGNFAAVVAQRAARERLPLRHQLLLYPVTDCAGEGPGYEQAGEAYFLTTTMMRWYLAQYLLDRHDAADPAASPLRQLVLAGAPEATIITAGYDLLRAEAEEYARALQQSGVPTVIRCWPGQVHGFASMLGVLDDADEALGFAAERLRQAFV